MTDAMVCPNCGMPIPEPPPPPEVIEAIRQMVAKTAAILGCTIDEDALNGMTGIALASLALSAVSSLGTLKIQTEGNHRAQA